MASHEQEQRGAFLAAKTRLGVLVAQTVPSDRRGEVSRAISQYVAAAVRDDRARRPVTTRALFGPDGVFGRLFGARRGRP